LAKAEALVKEEVTDDSSLRSRARVRNSATAMVPRDVPSILAISASL
jgi:hypothetical protein